MKFAYSILSTGFIGGLAFSPSGGKPKGGLFGKPRGDVRGPVQQKPMNGVRAHTINWHKLEARLIDQIDPEKAYTILCFGTGQDEHTPNTVIGEIKDLFGDELDLNEWDDFVAIPGPGAGTPNVGTYKHYDKDKAFDPNAASETFGRLAKFPISNKLVDLIRGASCAQAAATAVSAYFDNLPMDENDDEAEGKLAGVVNLVGYSRGAAVTVIRIHNLLKILFDKFPDEMNDQQTRKGVLGQFETMLGAALMRLHKVGQDLPLIKKIASYLSPDSGAKQRMPVKVNMFLIDPVAGMNAGLKPENKLMVDEPDDAVILESLVVCYAMHDRKKTYTPQYPDRLFLNADTKHYAFWVPGRHKTLGVRDSTRSDPGACRRDRGDSADWVQDPAVFIAGMIVRFLAANHVDLSHAIEKARVDAGSKEDSFFSDLSTEGLEKLYNKMMKNRGGYEGLSQGKSSLGDTCRESVKALGKLQDRECDSMAIKENIYQLIRDPSVSFPLDVNASLIE